MWTLTISSRERDSAARIAQSLPTLFGVGERKREIGRYALLAHAGLNPTRGVTALFMA